MMVHHGLLFVHRRTALPAKAFNHVVNYLGWSVILLPHWLMMYLPNKLLKHQLKPIRCFNSLIHLYLTEM